MKLYNPYLHGYIDYPLDLSDNNIVINYHIEYETFFCPWFAAWLVVDLYTGDKIYIPYGEKNRRDIYVVTSFYLNHETDLLHGVFTMKYSQFLATSQLDIPDNPNNNLNNNYSNNNDNDDDDDDFDDLEFIKSIQWKK